MVFSAEFIYDTMESEETFSRRTSSTDHVIAQLKSSLVPTSKATSKFKYNQTITKLGFWFLGIPKAEWTGFEKLDMWPKASPVYVHEKQLIV